MYIDSAVIRAIQTDRLRDADRRRLVAEFRRGRRASRRSGASGHTGTRRLASRRRHLGLTA